MKFTQTIFWLYRNAHNHVIVTLDYVWGKLKQIKTINI
jgi:hypothetical protein